MEALEAILYRMCRTGFLLAIAVAALRVSAAADWPTPGGDPGSTRWSPLAGIDRSNVANLELAWTYRHGDFRSGLGVPYLGTAFEATPILADGRLVFPTPFNRVIALDPATGAELWTFDPEVPRTRLYGNMMISRGVSFWRDDRIDAPEPCRRRIFVATLDARLIALDAATGLPCEGFGAGGTVGLLEGIGNLADPADYNVTSPPTVLGDRVIVGSSIADMVRRIQPDGAVRAFDARTGALVWRFDTIPKAGEPGHETWEDGSAARHGGANVWSTITADPARGLVFLPVSTVGPDFYGGDRPGANLFSDAVVALEAATGKRVWHFQTVHHDLWDYDLAAPPVLVTVTRDGAPVDAVAQATKTGLVFVLDRETGAPLFPVEERPVPASDVPRERAWPTQPFPLKPPPLVPHHLTEDRLWPDHPGYEQCRRRLRALRNEGIFTPPSERGSIVYPSTAGGANWSGGAFDPERRLFFVPLNDWAMTIHLKKLPEENFAVTDGIVLGSLFRGAWWLWRGTGTGLRYHMIRDGFFEAGLPCNRPPWGTLAAVDLDEGRIAWKVPVGETEEGIPGARNFGPPLATAGGLVFHGGAPDGKLRAHDAETGRVLATFDLPAGLHAGPMTYEVGGRQVLVAGAGGHVGLGSKLGDWILAWTLPDDPAARGGPPTPGPVGTPLGAAQPSERNPLRASAKSAAGKTPNTSVAAKESPIVVAR